MATVVVWDRIVIPQEETELMKRFGDEYRAYRGRDRAVASAGRPERPVVVRRRLAGVGFDELGVGDGRAATKRSGSE